MLIKAAADRARDLKVLTELLDHPKASAETRARIDKEIRTIRAGAKGEAEAAYEIDFHFGASRNWAVIHDLRLQHQGMVAQIDHVLIGRAMDFWVCESKHFSEGVSINEEGEFTAFFGRRPYGVPSPIEQNRKHVAVLKQVLTSSIVNLPTRLGIALRPSVESVVLVSKGARISRPKVKIDGLDRVIKSDHLRSLIEREIDRESVASSLLSMTKVIGSETLEELARQIAGLHRPIEFDWFGKFGLGPASIATKAEAIIHPAPPKADFPGHTGATAVPSRASAANSTTDEAASDPHEGRISTSKLAAAKGMKSARDALEWLVAAGYLELHDGQHRLTERGLQAGGRFVEKSRYGPYFLWPANLAA